MSAGDDNGRNGAAGDDALAGEYVLGVLNAAQRLAVERRIASDPSFAARVNTWQRRLSPLDDAYEPVTPPDGLFKNIERRLFPAAKPSGSGIWVNLAFWRGLVVASWAALGLFWLSGGLEIETTAPNPQLAASLQAENSPVRLLAFYDPASATLRVSTLSGAAGADKDFELWLIEGTNAPVSIGVLPKTATASLSAPTELRSKFTSGVTLAVSLEPLGGSPTTAPTGPVVALGTVHPI